MQAYMLNRYGGPDCAALCEVPQPVPGPAEILIKVGAAGLNPVDYKTRQGMLRTIQSYSLPTIMGNELSGTVMACGAKAERFKVGDRVYVRVEKGSMGAFSEYTCVPQDIVARMPANLDFASAAAVPLAALTAFQCLRDELKVAPGQRILITGGAGGVGTFAIQLAKWIGAEVITTASARGHQLVQELGADTIIDYTRGNFQDQLKDLDGALDLVGGASLKQALAVVKTGATVVSVAGMPEPQTARDLDKGSAVVALFWLISLPSRMLASKHGVHYRYHFMHPSALDLSELATLIEAATIKVTLDRTFPFAQIAEAMAYLETGRAKGKVVVTMAE